MDRHGDSHSCLRTSIRKLAGSNRMDSGQEIVLIDTNVFIIDLRYQRDRNFALNRRFLEYIKRIDRGFTTLINLFEICGILSFNLNHEQLLNLWTFFPQKYGISVLPTPDFKGTCPVLEQQKVFDLITKRTSFGDALMVASIERYLPFAATLVTWDKDHIQNVFAGTVKTPKEYLSNR